MDQQTRDAYEKVRNLIDDQGVMLTPEQWLAFLEEIESDLYGKIEAVKEEMEAENDH